MFLMMILSSIIISDTTTGADSNDKLDTLLSYMVRMNDDMKLLNQKVDGVQEKVKDVSGIEELTSEHLLKLEEKVADVIDKQGKMENHLMGVEQNIANQISAVQNQVSAIEKKVEKVDRDVFVAPALTWRFVGNGVQGQMDAQVSKQVLF